MSKQEKDIEAIIAIATSTDPKRDKWYGVYGGPGVGKSYTIENLVKEATKNRLTVQVTATTGKAASLIDGMTLHSYFGMRMQVNESAEQEEDAMQVSDPKSEVGADILIVDEASMLGRHEVNALMKMTPHFGAVVLVGDTDQLPPVKSKKPNLFGINHITLTKQHRMKNPAMTKLVTDIRLLLDDELTCIDLRDYADSKSVHIINSIPAVQKGQCVLAYHNSKVESYIPEEHGNHYNLFGAVTETILGSGDLTTEMVYPNGYDLELELTPLERARGLKVTRKGGHYIYRGYLLPKIDIPNQYLAMSTDGTPFIAHKGTLDELKKLREVEFNIANGFKQDLMAKYKTKKIGELKEIMGAENKSEWSKVWANYMRIASVIHIRPVEARTIHKSQGSTLTDVFVDMDDISKAKGKQLHAIYVAMSRATDNLYIKGSNESLKLWGANS